MALPASVVSDSGARSDARLLNMGLGGACLDLPEGLDVGQAVTLHVATPVLWDPLVVHGKVAWRDARDDGTTRIGLTFDHERSRVIRGLFELLGADEFG
jgi:hypothetical protein